MSENLQRQYEEAKERAQDAAGLIKSSGKNVAALTAKLQGSDNQLAQLQQKNDRAIMNLEQKLSNTEMSMIEAQTDLRKTGQELAQTRAQLEALQNQTESSATINDAISALQQQMQHATTEREEREEARDEEQQKRNEDGGQEKVAELEAELDSKNDELIQLTERLAVIGEQQVALEDKLEMRDRRSGSCKNNFTRAAGSLRTTWRGRARSTLGTKRFSK